MEHENPLLEILKIADLPINALLVLFMYTLWREYVKLRQQFTDYLMARRMNGDDAARIALDTDAERRGQRS